MYRSGRTDLPPVGSVLLPARPLRQEVVRLQLCEVGAQGPRHFPGVVRVEVPEERDLARVDLEHLDRVDPPGVEAAAALAHAELVGAVGPHDRCAAAASSSSASPWKTCPSHSTAGTSRIPSSAASAVASASRCAVPFRPAPFSSAAGWISAEAPAR